MYELIQVGSKTYYIDCPAKMGLYQINEQDVCLIDSGNDKDAGKKAFRIIEEHGWKLSVILNTHSHADHIGGNQWLQQRTGCKIYTRQSDRGLTESPILEPALLFGAYPPKELRTKALMAKESLAEELTAENLPQGLTVIPLEGHTDAQFGIITDDDVVFLADCLVGESILNKYRISYIFDVDRYMKTLEVVKEMTGAVFVPAHGEVTTDVKNLVEANTANARAIMEDLLGICAEKQTMEELIGKIFDRYGLTVNFSQYYLNSVTLKAMVSYLHDEGKLGVIVEGNRIYWQSIFI